MNWENILNNAINSYATGGKKTLPPIYVDNRNDPRLRKYQDSLTLFNLSKRIDPIENRFVEMGKSGIYKSRKEAQEALNKLITDSGGGFGKKEEIARNRLKAEPKYFSPEYLTFKTKDNDEFGVVNSTWKKPTQPIIYKKPPPPTPKTNFEQRIENPTNKIQNEDGSISTHKMMNWESDGKYYAAPTIIEINGKLVELNPNDAIDYAFKNKEFKEFSSDKEAQEYANNGYKKGTPLEQPIIEQNIPIQQSIVQEQIPVKQDFSQYMQPKGYSRQGQSAERQSESFYDANGKMTGQIIGGQYVPTEYGKFLQSGMNEDEYLKNALSFAIGGEMPTDAPAPQEQQPELNDEQVAQILSQYIQTLPKEEQPKFIEQFKSSTEEEQMSFISELLKQIQ